MIVYASRTGNVRYIVGKLGFPSIEIEEGLIVDKPFILFTYTDGLGDVPKKVELFIKDNYRHCKGIIGSGNTNFGNKVFCGAVDKLSREYKIPVIHKIELRGFQQDYNMITEAYHKIIEREEIN